MIIKMCISIYDLDPHVTVTYVIVSEIMVGIILSEHIPIAATPDQVANFTVGSFTSHYQLPSSIQILTVKNNQPTNQARSCGPTHSSMNVSRACGRQRQCSGFTVIITLAPEYRNQFIDTPYLI
jgi:hypothetical protein